MGKKWLFLLAVCVAFPVAGAHRYELVPLGSLAGGDTRATALNESNQVTGVSALPDEGVSHAFIWEEGIMTDLGTVDDGSSYASDINNDGVVVGWVESPEGARAVKFEDGGITVIGEGLPVSYAHGINDSGRVVGAAQVAGLLSDPRPRPYELSPGQANLEGGASFVDRPGRRAVRINNAGQILIHSGPSMFRMPEGVRLLAPGQSFVEAPILWEGSAGALNELGEAGGHGRLEFLEGQAVLWREGTLVHLPSPGGSRAAVRALNNQGQAAGNMTGPLTGPEGWGDAILWENGMGYRLRDLIEGELAREAMLMQVVDMNDAGVLLVNLTWPGPAGFPDSPASTGGAVENEATRPVEAFLLRPIETVELPVAMLAAPENKTVFEAREAVTVSWESEGNIASLEIISFPVRSTRPFVQGIRLGGNPSPVTNAVSPAASSATLTDLPMGPVAITLQGRDENGVHFVSPPRFVRMIGPARLIPVRRTSNGQFQIALDHSPEVLYQLEWTTNLIDWNVAHSLGAPLFNIPFLEKGMVLARAVKVANEGGSAASLNLDDPPEVLPEGTLRLFPSEGTAYEVQLRADGTYQSEGVLGSGGWSYEPLGRKGKLLLSPAGAAAPVRVSFEFGISAAIRISRGASHSGFYRMVTGELDEIMEEIGDFRMIPSAD